jgi:tRNA-dihydrouridine synthase
VSKVCRTGAGAALLGDLDLAAAVVEAMVRAVDIPVTVKMRRGLTPQSAAPVEAARRLEAAGAAALCVHPRAAAEEYGGRSDHRITAEVVAAVDIPVIANGDIMSPAEACAVLEHTGAAAVAVGRGALGNPWAFGALAHGAAPAVPGLAEILSEVEGFAREAAEVMGVDRACHYMRKFYPWYLSGRELPAGTLERLLVAPSLDDALGMLARLVPVPNAA